MPGPTKWAIAVLLGALAVMPAWASPYLVSLMVTVFMYVALAGSWNLFSGMTGYTSLGHGIFFGMGAYAFAVATVLLHWHPLAGFAMAACVSAMTALVLGLVLLTTRLRVTYFAILMLGFNEIAQSIVATAQDVGSTSGLTLSPLPSNFIAYYFLLAVALGVILLAYVIRSTRWGLGLRAIVADEVAARVTGVGTAAHKMAMFVLSALPIGLTGAMIAWYWSYVNPFTAFDLLLSFEMLVMAVFGGVGTVVGPVLGAVVMSVVKTTLATSIPQFYTIVFGALVVVLMIWCPGGMIQAVDLLRKRIKRGAHSATSEVMR